MRTLLNVIVTVALSAQLVSAQKRNFLSDSELTAITTRGRYLAAYDIASWHATDAVMALKPPNGAIARYIARKTDAGWVVVFGRFDETKDGFLISYEATQGKTSQEFAVTVYDPPRNDTGFFYIAAKGN